MNQRAIERKKKNTWPVVEERRISGKLAVGQKWVQTLYSVQVQPISKRQSVLVIGTRMRKKWNHGISIQFVDHHNCNIGAGNSPSNTEKQTLFQKNEKGFLFFIFYFNDQFLYKKSIYIYIYKYYIHNIFTTNHRWLVVIGSNLNLTLRLFFCSNNNNQ